jgi:beta-fructofuranosidase
MTIRLADSWIWDSWYTFDGNQHHAFYLKASRALQDPERRHRHPVVGHSVSDDLINWQTLPDAIIVSDEPDAFDSYTTWTGSVVRDESGLWWMFYTGTNRADGGDIQRIGAATSPDLLTWTKVSKTALVQADPTWYELLDKSVWHDQAFRDPWVFKNESDPSLWHMLVTARANEGDPRTRGVIGHATSRDLINWQVEPPLSKPGQGFGQQEVFQYEVVDGVPILLFCCGWRELSAERQAALGQISTTYSLVVSPNLTDAANNGVDFNNAKPFDGPQVYAGRLVQGKDGKWNLLGFIDQVDGKFVGEICDPIPVTATLQHGIVRR